MSDDERRAAARVGGAARPGGVRGVPHGEGPGSPPGPASQRREEHASGSGTCQVFASLLPDSIEVTFGPGFTKKDVAALKALPGRRWHPARRVWTLPRTPEAESELEARFGRRLRLSRDPASSRDAPGTRVDEDPVPEETFLLDRFRQEVLLKGYSPRTRKVYHGQVRRFVEWCGPEAFPGDPEAVVSRARRYLEHLTERGVSRSYHNQAVSALKVLLGSARGGGTLTAALPRPRGERGLPQVLSRDEVVRLLSQARHPKHRALLMLLYSAGLRVGEVVRLRPEDLDGDRGMLRVRRGKGAKDRYTLLSARALDAVRVYCEAFPPGPWLFPGPRRGRHYSIRSVQRVVKSCATRAGIRKTVTAHTLRHSFATHLMESGTSLRLIQELLGHTTPRTTQIYTHVARTTLAELRSPLDSLVEPADGDP